MINVRTQDAGRRHAGFRPGRRGRFDFLDRARAIFTRQGDLPFVHRAAYEKAILRLYRERFGDPDSPAARVLDNLLDLLPVTQRAVALPLYSNGLKTVEKYVGFKRGLREVVHRQVYRGRRNRGRGPAGSDSEGDLAV